MTTNKVFSIFNIYILLFTGICVCSIASAQQQPNEYILTKDITYSHVDGGKKITLDVSKHLDLKSEEIKKLIHILSVSQFKNIATSFKGVKIELLKPADSDIHPKSLVIREIRSSSSGKLVYKLDELPKELELNLSQLEDIESPKEILKDLDIKSNEIIVLNDGIDARNTLYIKLHNTTKSRINLKDWKIRITYGSTPFMKGEKDPRIIDIMSYDNQKGNGETLPILGNSAPDYIFPGYITMKRKIDFKLLNNPSKTQNEQLTAISDGMINENWGINWTYKFIETVPSWVEISDDTETLIKIKDKNGIIWINPDAKDKKKQQEIVKPRADDNSQPINDR